MWFIAIINHCEGDTRSESAFIGTWGKATGSLSSSKVHVHGKYPIDHIQILPLQRRF